MLPESEIDYHLSEGCGVFAVALAKFLPKATVVVISDRTGESWSEDFPYEATHVCLRVGDAFLDALGVRPLLTSSPIFRAGASSFRVFMR